MHRALTVLAAAQGGPVIDAAAVDVGTRDVLLASLLQATAGDLVPACADCPRCGHVMDVPVDLAAVGGLPVHEPGEGLSVMVGGAQVRFRLPTTADLIALAGLPPARDRAALLAACLGAGSGELPPADVASAVEDAMERAAPAGAIDILVRCPYCGLESALPLDVPALIWTELDAQATALLRDVHDLATSYGWTEADVLALGPRRRAMYLALVDDA